jgi:hypothetical protein
MQPASAVRTGCIRVWQHGGWRMSGAQSHLEVARRRRRGVRSIRYGDRTSEPARICFTRLPGTCRFIGCTANESVAPATVPWTEMKAREIICGRKASGKAKVRRGLSRVSGAVHYADGQRVLLVGASSCRAAEGRTRRSPPSAGWRSRRCGFPRRCCPNGAAGAVDNHCQVTIQITASRRRWW